MDSIKKRTCDGMPSFFVYIQYFSSRNESVQGRELVCAHITKGAEEVLGEVLKSGARSNVLLGYSHLGVILPTAYVANIFLHNDVVFVCDCCKN
jgi:hypothetical protein